MLAGFLLIQVLGGLTDFPHFAGPQIGFAGRLLPMDGNSGWKYERVEYVTQRSGGTHCICTVPSGKVCSPRVLG